MKKQNLPKTIIYTFTGDTLSQKENDHHNDHPLCVAQFFDDYTAWYNDIVLYQNDETKESLYISVFEKGGE